MWTALPHNNLGYCLLLSLVLISLLNINRIQGVTFPKNGEIESNRANYGVHGDELGVCLRTDDPLVPCLTSSMVQSIESASDIGVVDLDDRMRLIQDPDYERRVPTGDPREAHTLLEAITMYLEPRFLHWDLSDFYPGLMMRVGPSSRNYLQFFLDKRKIIDDRSLSTGRLIVKRTVLPVLLGIKLNIAALAPLLIAGLILIVKKILVVSKFSFIIAAISLFLNYRRQQSSFGGNGGGVWAGGNGGSLGSFGSGSFGSGSFGPKKLIRIERPAGWFGREDDDPLQPLE